MKCKNANHENFLKRSLFYSSNSYSNQIKKGESYDKLKTVIFIGIMGYNLFTKEKDLDKYLSTHLLLNKETLSQRNEEDFEFHFIELQKFNKTECELDGIIDQWIYFLKIAEEGEIPENRIEEILEAYETVQESNFTKREVEVC
ncbi:MAG: PD-(D/E)XK nuclease family transposase [Candidatus Gracilibacteria bacterium]|nr:PD-(D/E)XK nuclease family transposase [Candidatus Gracilibacteria bacterium]